MFDKLIEKVKAEPKKIVFTEGSDARIQEAAARLLAEDLMGVVLVGNEDEIKAAAAESSRLRSSIRRSTMEWLKWSRQW